jgi:hypothetical protein
MRKVVGGMGSEELDKIKSTLSKAIDERLPSLDLDELRDISSYLDGAFNEAFTWADVTARQAWDDGYSRGITVATQRSHSDIEWARKASYAQGYEDGLSAATGELRGNGGGTNG